MMLSSALPWAIMRTLMPALPRAAKRRPEVPGREFMLRPTVAISAKGSVRRMESGFIASWMRAMICFTSALATTTEKLSMPEGRCSTETL